MTVKRRRARLMGTNGSAAQPTTMRANVPLAPDPRAHRVGHEILRPAEPVAVRAQLVTPQ
jgi:hypothetical protein